MNSRFDSSLFIIMLAAFVLAVCCLAGSSIGAQTDGADLEVVRVWFEPGEGEDVYSGEVLTIKFEIKNNGPDAWDSQVLLFKEIDLEEEQIHSVETENMSAGQPIVFTYNYVIPTTESGAASFRVNISKEDNNPNNNDLSEDKYIFPPAPDVIPGEIVMGTEDLIYDNHVDVTVSIWNNGTAKAFDVIVRLIINDSEAQTIQVDQIDADSSFPFSYDWLIEDVGDIEFQVTVAIDDEEMDEENNIRNKTFTTREPGVDDKPDFVLWAPVIPEFYKVNNAVTYTFVVYNNGTRGWSDDVLNVSLIVEGTWIDSDLVSMAAGDYADVELTWDLSTTGEGGVVDESGGDYYVSLHADPLDKIDEESEYNNHHNYSAEVTPPSAEDHPDLMVTASDLIFKVGNNELNQTETIKEGTNLVIIARITNLGNMNAKNVPYSIYIGDDAVKNATFDIGGQWSGDYLESVGYSWKGVIGTHTISIMIDPLNSGAVNETDENNQSRRENNDASRDIEVVEGQRADFSIDDDDIVIMADDKEVTKVNENKQVTAEFTVTNSGEVTGTCVVYLLDSRQSGKDTGTVIFKETLEDLGAGESEDLEFMWKANGSYVHYIQVDILNGSTKESDTSNNFAERTLEVKGTPKPDLIVESVGFDNSYPLRNESVKITAVVKNVGDVTVTTDFTVEFFLLKDGEALDSIGTSPVTVDLDIDQTGAVLLVWDINYWAPGQYQVEAVADNKGAGEYHKVEEKNEGNNSLAADLTIGAIIIPDISIVSANPKINGFWDREAMEYLDYRTAPSTAKTDIVAVSNKTLDFKFTVTNEGSFDFNSVRIKYNFYEAGGSPGPAFVTVVGELFQDAKEEPVISIEMPNATDFEEWIFEAEVYNDYPDDDEEAFLGNNYQTISLWVIPDVPDIEVVTFYYPGLITVFEKINLTAAIMNKGPASAEVIVDFDMAGKTAQKVIGPLAPGETENVTFSMTFPEKGSFLATVETSTDEGDLDNSDNDWEETLSVFSISGIDLIVIDLQSDLKFSAGKTVIVSATIENQGSVGAEMFSVRLYVNGVSTSSFDVHNLRRGETEKIDFSWKPTIGNYNITVVVDADDEVNEFLEDNNEAWIDEVIVEPAEKKDGDEEMNTMFIVVVIVIVASGAGIGIFFLFKKMK